MPRAILSSWAGRTAFFPQDGAGLWRGHFALRITTASHLTDPALATVLRGPSQRRFSDSLKNNWRMASASESMMRVRAQPTAQWRCRPPILSASFAADRSRHLLQLLLAPPLLPLPRSPRPRSGSGLAAWPRVLPRRRITLASGGHSGALLGARSAWTTSQCTRAHFHILPACPPPRQEHRYRCHSSRRRVINKSCMRINSEVRAGFLARPWAPLAAGASGATPGALRAKSTRTSASLRLCRAALLLSSLVRPAQRRRGWKAPRARAGSRSITRAPVRAPGVSGTLGHTYWVNEPVHPRSLRGAELVRRPILAC